jgi:hypothetical protein
MAMLHMELFRYSWWFVFSAPRDVQYLTMSKVTVNKAKTEELIEGMVLSLQAQYRRIQMVKEVYTSSEMKKRVATVYQLGIEFLYEAVRYYSIGTFRRLWQGLTGPPSTHLALKVSEIEAAPEEIRKEMEVLDGRRLHQIVPKVDKVVENVQLIQKEVEGVNKEVRLIKEDGQGMF